MTVRKTLKSSDDKARGKRFAWITALLCIGCCSLPFILGLFLGFSVLAGMAVYFESIALLIVLAASGLFVYGRHRRRITQKDDAASCDVNCDCKNG